MLAQIIHLVLFINSLEMFIFSLWGLTPEYFKQMLNGFIFFKKSVIPQQMPKINSASTITNIKGTSTPTIAKTGIMTY